MAVLVSVVAVTAPPADAHLDPGTKIGEYRVTLNWVRVDTFAAGFLGDPTPDVFLRTFTQAATHDGQTAVFGVFNDLPVGTKKGIGRLIYWHLDCKPSENLQLIVDMGDVDGGLGPLVNGLLSAGAGIVALKEPLLGGAANAAADYLSMAIDEELSSMGAFPQWATAGFTKGDNSGEWIMSFANAGALPRSFSFSVTFQYVPHDEYPCTVDGRSRASDDIRRSDEAVQDLFRRLGDDDRDGYTNDEERALGSNPNDPKSVPENRQARQSQQPRGQEAELPPSPSCFDGVDNDKDGTVDSLDGGCRAPNTDGDAVGDYDNCPRVRNDDQANADDDGYGNACDNDDDNDSWGRRGTAAQGGPKMWFDDMAEAAIGTDRLRGCAATATANDEGLPDRWPADFNDDRRANSVDASILDAGLAGPYRARFDLDHDGALSSHDKVVWSLFAGRRCGVVPVKREVNVA